MGANRRHHYVPQFYLRRFSSGRAYIDVYNKAAARWISGAPIKGQCQIPRYYDWSPEVEKTLSSLEGRASALFTRICDQSSLHHISKEDWELLILFTAIQSARVKVTGDSNNDLVDHYAKLFLQGETLPKGLSLDDFQVKETFPTAIPIEVMLNSAKVFASLSVSLLINTSSIPFYATDNPVIKYNSQSKHIKGQGTVGLDQPGLQLIYPLDPRHALYFYDPEAYRNPSNTGSRKIGIKDSARILMLSYLWAGANLYLGEGRLMTSLSLTQQALSEYEGWKRVEIIETDLVETDQGFSSLIASSHPHPPIEIEFDFAGIKAKYDADMFSRSEPKRSPLGSAGKDVISYQVKDYTPRVHFSGVELKRLTNTLASRAIRHRGR